MFLFRSECMTILSGWVGTVESGAEIPGTERWSKWG